MTSKRVGREAVVVGAGVGGIAAAGALAPFFDRITVLERDRLAAEPAWRLGAPQGRHVHVLLAGGQRALEQIFPGFTEALLAGGAVATRANSDSRFEAPGFGVMPQRDFGWLAYNASRPLIEFTARRCAEGLGVEFRERARVRSLEADVAGRTVLAVHYEDDARASHRLAADLIVDASGRGHPTLDLLEALGRPAPEETVIGVDLAYASVVLERPPDPPRDWKVVLTLPEFPQSTRAGLIAPIEQDRWILTLGGRQDDAPPTDEPGFRAFAASLSTPTISGAIAGARLAGDIASYGFRDSVWRRFERLEALPRGLIPFSDSVCRFNPVYGQGMSVAAQEGALIAEILSERAAAPDPLAGLADEFLEKAQAVIEGPWQMSAIPDFANPATRGERPPNIDQILAYGAAFGELARRDAEVHKLDAEVRQLIKPPSALADPALTARVMAVMREMQPAA
ncbi:MAG TPA: hypothetical protein VGS12_11680 [Caulobacteraceae bacterium]|nr:hypothetical protein [Caulobacteraceae bacterium]